MVIKLKYFLGIVGVSILLFLVITPLRLSFFGGYPTSSLVGFFAEAGLAWWCCKRFNTKLAPWQILLALLIGSCVLELPVRISRFESTFISFPDLLIRTLGVICGFLYWRMKKPANILVFALFAMIPVFMFFRGYDHWLQKLNFGTFTGNVSYAQPAGFEATDKAQRLISDIDFNDKIVLLDFWHTACGVCFQKFPKLQALHEKYKDDPSVMIMAVNKPLEDDKPGEAFNVIEERGYTFPVVIPQDEDLPKKFGVASYPTTFIIAGRQTIVFKGDITFAAGKIEELRSGLR